MNPRRQVEVELRRWLRSHHSVIGYTEARHLGASPRDIECKLDRGEWARIYRSVFCDAAAPPGPYQDLRAACVATAGFGVASHASAAWLWGLLRDPPEVPEVSVRRGMRDARGQSGLRIHRSRDLDGAAATVRKAILVTNPLRTLVDLAGAPLPAGRLTEAVDTALAKRLVTTAGLEAEIQRLSRRGRGGVGALRRHLLDQGFIGAPAPSVLEARMRRLIVTTGISWPTVECRAGEEGQYRLDLAWSAILLAVEVDGYVWHFSPDQMRRDDARRNHLMQTGWRVLVYTWHDVVKDPGRVAREITSAFEWLTAAARQPHRGSV